MQQKKCKLWKICICLIVLNAELALKSLVKMVWNLWHNLSKNKASLHFPLNNWQLCTLTKKKASLRQKTLGKVRAISLRKILATVRTYANFYAKNCKLQANLFLNLSLTKKMLLNFYNTVIIANRFVKCRPTAFWQ